MSVFHRTLVAGRIHRRRNDASSAPAFYVSTAGNDANDGSLAAPWRTIGFAVHQLQAGDTLYVRGGRYDNERNITWTCPGTEEAPVTIKNYPGEHPIIDGSLPEFREGSPEAPNSAWEPYEVGQYAGKSIYRSVATYPGPVNGTGAHLLEDGVFYLLGALKDISGVPPGIDYMASDQHNHDNREARYMGPCVYWHSSDSRLYIRLVPSTAESTHGTPDSNWYDPANDFSNIAANTDPRQNQLFICVAAREFLRPSGSYLIMEGLDIRHYHRTFFYTGDGHYHHYKKLKIYPHRVGFNLRGTNHIFETIDLRTFGPPWVSRIDTKGHEEPLERLRTAGISCQSNCNNIKVLNCFIESFDGILMTSSTNHTLIVKHCTFFRCDDDGIQLGSKAYNSEFAYNKVITSAGAGHHGTGQADEPVKWFHHNIYDNTVLRMICRHDPLLKRSDQHGMMGLNIIPTHTGENAGTDPYKFYNNTIIIRDPYAASLLLGRWGQVPQNYTPEFAHEVLNNILVQEYWMKQSVYVTRNARVLDGGEVYDGNCWHTKTDNQMRIWLDARDEENASKIFRRIIDLHADPYWDMTKVHYPPGWEASGTQADPQLDAGYFPQTAGMLEGGSGIPNPVDLSGKGWPGYDGNYRGAIPPGGSHTTIGSTIQIDDVPMPP
jgi:hypothetical protein